MVEIDDDVPTLVKHPGSAALPRDAVVGLVLDLHRCPCQKLVSLEFHQGTAIMATPKAEGVGRRAWNGAPRINLSPRPKSYSGADKVDPNSPESETLPTGEYVAVLSVIETAPTPLALLSTKAYVSNLIALPNAFFSLHRRPILDLQMNSFLVSLCVGMRLTWLSTDPLQETSPGLSPPYAPDRNSPKLAPMVFHLYIIYVLFSICTMQLRMILCSKSSTHFQ
ncbi:hypothetical protein BD410DRAFT_613085 [Rickenella mellea]|uniref:Uncharacterized protein n=1 Tax=Rickenella mellea TaxID=50990 RepID=A0A4Y7PNN1_9AGAM|nr:hypothetical protein BD410DRAFT_613085 [Rickenella mellea]